MKIETRVVCGDTVYQAVMPNGVRVSVCPKKGYSSSYAIFGTAYGSVDTEFCRENESPVTVPPGIAHYLEHKMFEKETESADERFARTGASANAYTSFDKTCYLFSCADQFLPSLEILLDFVQTPYFTPETVQKEQGIIGQEIRMCEDNPNRRVLWNLLRALYQRHPVRIEIAGTVESIAKIDADLLYRCYHTFYQPSNMALCVAGNVNPDEVFATAERLLRPVEEQPVQRITPKEPEKIAAPRAEETFAVSVPLFYIGFKEPCGKQRKTARQLAETDILLELLASESSPLYRELMEDGLINQTFGYDYWEGPGYAAVLFGGESQDPDAVQQKLCAELQRLGKEKIDAESFECARRAVYGRQVASLGSVSAIAGNMAEAAFSGRAYGDQLEWTAKLTCEDVQRRLTEVLNPERMALSVLRPGEDETERK